MSKLADELLRGRRVFTKDYTPEEGIENVELDIQLKQLERLPKIECSNVAEFFYTASPKEDWCFVHDYPNMAPPLESFWAEFVLPKKINSEGNITDCKSAGWVVGMGVQSVSYAVAMERLSLLSKVLSEYPSTKWATLVTTFFLLPGHEHIYKSPVYVCFLIDEAGRYIAHIPFSELPLTGDLQEESDEVVRFMHPLMLAISFMHCKNVVIKNNVIPPKLQKKATKRYGVPLITYKVLDIVPMRTVLRSALGEAKFNLQKALHICRGHFKDYRETGLFGKLNGMFWWEPHVRGTAKAGVSVRDYDVKAA